MTQTQLRPGLSQVSKLWLVIFTLAYSVILAFWNLSAMPMENHEGFVSVTARTMLDTGNWTVPSFNGQLRLKKTPLQYWLVAGFSKVTGNIDEFTARFPSALLGFLTAAAILYFASGLFGLRAAVLATLVFSSTLSYTYYTHSARPEMCMSAFTIVSMLAFCCAINNPSRPKQIVFALVFWISFAIANLAKGPAPLLLVIPPVIAWFIVFKEYRLIRLLLPVIGPAVFLLILAPWPIAIILTEPNWYAIWKFEYIDRFIGDAGKSNRPFYYYIPSSFELFAPWAAFLVGSVAAPFFKVWDSKRRIMWFMWLWFVVDVVVMSLSAGKRRHYILPVVAPLAILSGIIFEDLVFILKAHTKKFARAVLQIHIGVLAAVFLLAPLFAMKLAPQLLQSAILISSAGIISSCLIAAIFYYRKSLAATLTVFACCGILMIMVHDLVIVPENPDWVSKKTALMLKEQFGPGKSLKAYNIDSPKLIHYFGQNILSTEDLGKLDSWYREGDYILCEQDKVPNLTNLEMKIAFVIENFKLDSKPGSALVFHRDAPADCNLAAHLNANQGNPLLRPAGQSQDHR